MQDPRNEITAVVKGLIEAPNADVQKKVMQTYFAPDAGFDHPLCAVRPGPNSRDSSLLPIYQWLKIMFASTIEVHSVGWDDTRKDRLYVDASQTLRPRVPVIRDFYAPVARLVVVLHLSQAPDGLYYIKLQEDIYQIQELPGRMLTVGPWIIMTIKLIAGFNCALFALVFQFLGIWSTTKDGRGLKEAPHGLLTNRNKGN